MVKTAMGKDLIKIVLYGSCARGDYTQDSDIDIALIMACDRLEAKKYNEIIAEISMRLAMKYFSVVNFVCLPYAELEEAIGLFMTIESTQSVDSIVGERFIQISK